MKFTLPICCASTGLKFQNLDIFHQSLRINCSSALVMPMGNPHFSGAWWLPPSGFGNIPFKNQSIHIQIPAGFYSGEKICTYTYIIQGNIPQSTHCHFPGSIQADLTEGKLFRAANNRSARSPSLKLTPWFNVRSPALIATNLELVVVVGFHSKSSRQAQVMRRRNY